MVSLLVRAEFLGSFSPSWENKPLKGEKADMVWSFTEVENAQRDDHHPATPGLIKA